MSFGDVLYLSWSVGMVLAKLKHGAKAVNCFCGNGKHIDTPCAVRKILWIAAISAVIL